MTANKNYNQFDHTGNKTNYTVELQSPLIWSDSEEIRVAIQWQWENELGIASERAVFYGTVGNGRFDEFRVDNFIKYRGSYQYNNKYFAALPKGSPYLSPQDSKIGEKFQIIDKSKKGP